MKSIISFFLIIGFFLVLSPGNTFHLHAHHHDIHDGHDGHDEHHHHVEKSNGDETTYNEHCIVCDVDLILFTPTAPFAYNFKKVQFSAVKEEATHVRVSNFSRVVTLRGPPRIA